MSDTHTITDDAILAAWGGAPEDWEPMWRQAAAEFLRRRLEAEDVGDDVVFRQSPEMRRPVDVTALRDRLGGWDAVWRAVLKDEGFVERIADRRWDYEGGTDWCLYVRRRPGTEHEWRLETWDLSIPLRSPADLRVRVGHARGLFGEGQHEGRVTG